MFLCKFFFFFNIWYDCTLDSKMKNSQENSNFLNQRTRFEFQMKPQSQLFESMS